MGIKQIDRHSQAITIVYTLISVPLFSSYRRKDPAGTTKGPVTDGRAVGRFDPCIYRHPGKEQRNERRRSKLCDVWPAPATHSATITLAE